MEEDILTKAQAKERGLKHYFTGRPCKHGHLVKRLVSSGTCMECDKLYSAKWRGENVEKIRAYSLANADEANRRAKVHYAKHVEQKREYARKRYLESRDVISRSRAEYQRQYVRANRDRILKRRRDYRNRADIAARELATMAQRRARRLQATPVWCEESAIQAIYLRANLLRETLNLSLHVDHYYPLKGHTVCGLHVPENLRIITAEENVAKKNKHPEDWEREKLERGLSYPSLEDSLS